MNRDYNVNDKENVNMMEDNNNDNDDTIIISQNSKGNVLTIVDELKPIKEMIECMDYVPARALLEGKFLLDPNCVEVIDLLSDIYFNQDNIEGAIKMIKKSISLDPESNPEKYMTLAQIINNPKLSLQCYQKGIELYIKQLSINTHRNKDDLLTLRDSIASGYASIVELYMTTALCDEIDAESVCENSIKLGLNYNPDSFDVLLQLSNLRILRQRDIEAKEVMDKLLNQIKAIDTNHVDFPDHDFALNLSKNYAELSLYIEAIYLLDILVKLDDEDLECWYLLAFYHYQIKNYQFSRKCLKNFQKAQAKVIIQNKTNEIKEFEDAAKELFNILNSMKQELTNQIEEHDYNHEKDNDDSDEEMNN